jgi:pyruvate/2-oxoglutarate dehydrogenase complex dihydrolipoamide acyltransferase (E2) component
VIFEFRAPKTGLTVENVEIIQWHKKEKDYVEKEEILVTIETDKVSLDIPSPLSGWLAKILAKEGESAPVGQTIALIADVYEENPDERI